MHTDPGLGSISSYGCRKPRSSASPPSADGPRGGGNELALACDLRYASREHAIFGQPKVATGILPGGGGSERLPRLIGRDRALEAILSGYDYDADLAERHGWVTRTIPDAELDRFVDGVATRLASFDKTALAAAKARIELVTTARNDVRDFVESGEDLSCQRCSACTKWNCSQEWSPRSMSGFSPKR